MQEVNRLCCGWGWREKPHPFIAYKNVNWYSPVVWKYCLLKLHITNFSIQQSNTYNVSSYVQTKNVSNCSNPFLIGGELLYNIALVSALHQHDSATGIPLSPRLPTGIPLKPHPPPTLLSCHRALCWAHTANSHTPSILHMVICMFPCCSLNSSHIVLPTVLCVCISVVALPAAITIFNTKIFHET